MCLLGGRGIAHERLIHREKNFAHLCSEPQRGKESSEGVHAKWFNTQSFKPSMHVFMQRGIREKGRGETMFLSVLVSEDIALHPAPHTQHVC